MERSLSKTKLACFLRTHLILSSNISQFSPNICSVVLYYVHTGWTFFLFGRLSGLLNPRSTTVIAFLRSCKTRASAKSLPPLSFDSGLKWFSLYFTAECKHTSISYKKGKANVRQRRKDLKRLFHTKTSLFSRKESVVVFDLIA